MAWIRALAPIVLAAGAALASLPVLAQPTAPAAKVKREKVDVRAMVPGPQVPDAASDVRPASGLTRDQRKEATLQARQDGTLQPAGDAAEPRETRPASVGGDTAGARAAAGADSAGPRGAAVADAASPHAAARAHAATPRAAAVADAMPSPAGGAEVATNAPATVAAAPPASASTKKSLRKKAKGAAGATPA